MKKPGFLILGLALQMGFPQRPCLADWPMWQCDAHRSGYTPESLPEALRLQWVLELPRPRPAWKGAQERLRFDHQYEPILHEGRLFVPSMVSDRMT
jgi:hypothetical protein